MSMNDNQQFIELLEKILEFYKSRMNNPALVAIKCVSGSPWSAQVIQRIVCGEQTRWTVWSIMQITDQLKFSQESVFSSLEQAFSEFHKRFVCHGF